MHSCEAMLGTSRCHGRDPLPTAPALLLPKALPANKPPRLKAWFGSIRQDWSPDWDHNRHDKTNIFRPWGYQTGHLTEVGQSC